MTTPAGITPGRGFFLAKPDAVNLCATPRTERPCPTQLLTSQGHRSRLAEALWGESYRLAAQRRGLERVSFM